MYEGFKLNHFLAHTIFVKSMLNYVVIHPSVMLAFLWVFTLIELGSGVLLLLGLGTRLLGLILFFLFMSLMFTAGWLGSTCLDEWTVATFGMGIGICLFLAGSGPFSLDSLIFKRFHHIQDHYFWSLLVSPELSFIHDYRIGKRYAMTLSILLLAFVMGTNQYLVGGVYGPFHNPAVAMNVMMHANLQSNGDLALTLYRNQGPDTYGAYIVKVTVQDSHGNIVLAYNANQLGHLPESAIKNYYLVQAKPNGHALLLPLSALVTLDLKPTSTKDLSAGKYTVVITDVSDKTWKISVDMTKNNGTVLFNPMDLVKL
jgi:thiosulfate dehydrogenase [quinone] large subunit